MTENDERLIEDYIPIHAISAEASREKNLRKGHISTLHLWWARRPLVACRAAVYGALVPASRFRPNNGPQEKRVSLGRANAARFVDRLCRYPGHPAAIAEAQRHLLEAHADRLTRERGFSVTAEDILAGRAPRPKVLDMFAGGGAIPLEALRLGCEAYALDLNPVAYIIQLCTLVYPQKYGNADANALGMTGPPGMQGGTTWGGLAREVRYWAEWVFKTVKDEIGDLYPLLLAAEVKGGGRVLATDLFGTVAEEKVSSGYLMPVVYLWTRIVKCKNPACGAAVPLSKLQWIRRERDDKPGRYVALLRSLDKSKKVVVFTPAEAANRADIQPSAVTTRAGSVACPFCGAVSDDDYVKAEGCAGRLGLQLMAIGVTHPRRKQRAYIGSARVPQGSVAEESTLGPRLQTVIKMTGLNPPDEPVVRDGKQSVWVDLYGLTHFGKVFTSRQLIVGLTVAHAIRSCYATLLRSGVAEDRAAAVCSFLGMGLDRHMNQNNTLTIFNAQGETVEGALNDKTLPMAWDFAEPNPFGGITGSLQNAMEWVVDVAEELRSTSFGAKATVVRGSATALALDDASYDAVVTDPPYYDNVSYAVLSDFFYAWLKRSIGFLYPEHFAAVGTPKKNEIVMDSVRHNGNAQSARVAYEHSMEGAFRRACAALKPNGLLACVYAHKTTIGWSTLVQALRRSGLCVTEAWPIETERKGGRKGGKAVLASSIFVVARKRERHQLGQYETEVKPELEAVVRERVATFWEMRISGADLVIASVGAGLRAFTRFARVEYANGEEVPAERFLSEVETVVLEAILGRLSKEVGGNSGRRSLVGVDPSTRFYTLWRYTYRTAELDAGEAIVFANGKHVELDGPGSLTYGSRPLVEKRKARYRLLDYADRGDDDRLGTPAEDGQPAPLIDALHRVLWLMENRPAGLPEFLRVAHPNLEQMRLVAQALAGPALKGGELADVSPSGELAALTKLTANWRSVVEDAAGGPLFRT